ncbi:MAG: hypothetical protein AB8B75_21420 [Roseobacter sp.]
MAPNYDSTGSTSTLAAQLLSNVRRIVFHVLDQSSEIAR